MNAELFLAGWVIGMSLAVVLMGVLWAIFFYLNTR